MRANVVIKTFLLIFVFAGMFFLTGCTNSNDEKSIQYFVRNLDGKDEEFLRRWLILGPFPNSEKKYRTDTSHGEHCTGYYKDFLTSEGGESKIRPIDGNIHVNDLGDTLTWTYHETPSNVVNFNKIYFPNDFKVAYAFSEIVSTKGQEILFAIGSDDGIKIWLNGELIHDHHVGRGIKFDRDRVLVHLNQGINSVLVKVDEGDGGWGFVFRLESVSDALKYTADHKGEMWPDILDDYVIPVGEQLKIKDGDMRLSLLPEIQTCQLYIVNDETEVRQKWDVEYGKAIEISLTGTPPGLYTLFINLGDQSDSPVIKENFYYGNVQPLLKRYTERFEPYIRSENRIININLTANLERLKVLYEYGKYGFSGDLSLRLVRLLNEMEEILSYLEQEEEPFIDRTGTHIRGYYSEIDDTVQYYQVHVPDIYNPNNSMPMVIHFHGVFETDQPFLKSISVDYINIIRDRERYAKENGFIVVWPHGRGNAMFKGIGRDDLFNVIEQVKSDYNIDEDRIYLTGYSFGGQAALDVASQYPHLFAAVAPIAAFTDYRLLLDSKTKLHESEKKWKDANNTITYIKNLLHIPVFIQHGDDDNFCDLRHSTRVVDTLKAYGGSVELKILPDANHFNYLGNPEERIYKWFKDKSRVKNPNKVIYVTSQMKYNQAYWMKVEALTQRLVPALINANIKGNRVYVTTKNVSAYSLKLNTDLVNLTKRVTIYTNGKKSYKGLLPFNGELTINEDTFVGLGTSDQLEGPISEVFSTPFVIVLGTNGNTEQINANKEAFSNFLAVWRERFFTNPRVKNDSELSAEDIGRFNLIFFGGPETNLIAKKIITKLPISYSKNLIIFYNYNYQLTDTYGIQMVYQNPLNPKKYVVLYDFSGWDSESKRKPMFDQFFLDAWYDFIFFDDSTYGPSVAPIIGFFDSNWQINNELTWHRHK